MLSKGAQTTKEKILEAAFELFGRYGLEGTSIREISKKSGVNLAAINYHFKHKENLYWEIMLVTYRELGEEIRAFSEGSRDVTELAMKTYDYFVREKYALRNVMKMMLEEGIQPPESEEARKILNNPMGPPGGEYFAAKIEAELGRSLSRIDLVWGVKAIFGVITHWAMMCCSTHIAEDGVGDPLMSPEQIRRDVERMVRASLAELRSRH